MWRDVPISRSLRIESILATLPPATAPSQKPRKPTHNPTDAIFAAIPVTPRNSRRNHECLSGVLPVCPLAQGVDAVFRSYKMGVPRIPLQQPRQRPGPPR
jgi:hypothetical protein